MLVLLHLFYFSLKIHKNIASSETSYHFSVSMAENGYFFLVLLKNLNIPF